MTIALISFICLAGFYLKKAYDGDEGASMKSILFSILGLLTAISLFIQNLVS